MEQEYKLRKDVDELQFNLEQTISDLNVLQAVTLNGEEYYTKEEVDEELERLRIKSEGLPYFYKNSNGDLLVDLPLTADYSFELEEDDLIVSLTGDNHFEIDDFGNLWYRGEVVGD